MTFVRSPRLDVGTSVEVHTRFNDSWSGGFEIADVLPSGYLVRRTHDHSVLPGATSDDDVRPVRDIPFWG
jgi:hypothetical protein